MPRVVTFCRSLTRRVVRAYRDACAHDDAVVHDIIVPDGVWACDWCDTVLIGSGAPSEHDCTAQTGF